MRRRPFRLGTSVSVGALLAMLLASSASAVSDSAFTTVFNGTGFLFRPGHIYLGSTQGGTYDLTWTSWNGGAATATGTSHASSGVSHVSVKLADPGFGTFQRLTVTFSGAAKQPENLDLATADGSGREQWASAGWISNRSASGLYSYDPSLSARCSASASAVGGRYHVTAGLACGIGVADLKAGGVKCEGSKSGHTVVVRSTYDGWTVTTQTIGALFERGQSYFTYDVECN